MRSPFDIVSRRMCLFSFVFNRVPNRPGALFEYRDDRDNTKKVGGDCWADNLFLYQYSDRQRGGATQADGRRDGVTARTARGTIRGIERKLGVGKDFRVWGRTAGGQRPTAGIRDDGRIQASEK